MKNISIRFYKVLISPRLAIVIFLVVTLASVTGGVLDSDFIKKAWPEANSSLVFKSSWFLCLSIILLGSTLLCTFRQIKTGIKRWRKYQSLTDNENALVSCEEEEKAFYVLRKHRFSVTKSNDGCWCGKKNSLGFIGAPLFHFGLALLFVGVMFDVFAGFSGTLDIRPGETILDKPQRYISIDQRLFNNISFDRFKLLLHKINMEYFPEGVKTTGGISIIEKNIVVKQGILNQNHQINLGLLEFSNVGYGYYVNYQIAEKNKEIIIQHSLGLNTLEFAEQDNYRRENYIQPGTNYRISIDYYPGLRAENKEKERANDQMDSSAIKLVISEGKKEIFNGIVKQGQKVTLADERNFIFSGVTPYLLVRVKGMLGTYIVGAGFVVFTIGLFIYYFLLPSVILVRRSKAGYKVEYFAWTGHETISRQVKGIKEKLD